jgi:hypothetical protein
MSTAGAPSHAQHNEAASISVNGDTDLARHWLASTAHVSG